MSELPEGWTNTTVGETSEEISYGFTASASQVPKGPKFLRITDIQNGVVDWQAVPFCNVPPNQASKYILKSGDIVFARTGATTGKSFLITSCPEAVFASYLIRVRPSKCILPELMGYFFQSSYYWQQITENLSGSAQPNCNATKLSTLRIPLPPLKEQHRIVAKLEKLLSRVDAAQARLAKIPRVLKRFRQSVLAAAASGRLTADWRVGNSNADSAIQLLQRIQKDRKRKYDEELKKAKVNGVRKQAKDHELVFTIDDQLPLGWAKAKLENLIYIAARIGWRGLKAEEYTKEGPLFLSVHNLNNGESVEFENAYHISTERYVESPEIQLKTNDILLTKDGAGIGKIGIVTDLPCEATVNSSLLVIRSLEAFVPKYLFYFLSGPELQNVAQARITGSATPHLFQKDIKEFVLSVPPLAEQQEIARRVEAFFKTADALEARYLRSKAHVDKLTQSILARAFRGELVTQDPNDEPASALLERIRRERPVESKKRRQKMNQ